MRFPIEKIDRDTTREQWEDLFRLLRKHGEIDTRDNSHIADKATIRKALDDNTEDGLIGVVESGMDCDCVRYCSGKAYAASDMPVIAFVRRRNDMHEWADGPCHLSLCKPSELPESYSRDLAMEAFEDGHSHVVYY